uniref:Protein kinase domain-containing protein n=1 Tax=Panagrolaimus superbus TaxID=310955 RepID=A0A914ZE17_9BILA
MKGTEWYLCLEADQTLAFKHYLVVENTDYLLAEMKSRNDFQLTPGELTNLTTMEAAPVAPIQLEQNKDGILITPEVQAIKIDGTGKFGALTNRFFRRFTLWPKPQINPGKWREHRPQHEINQSTLVGDFHHPPENVDYRILGMRPKRTVGNLVEYEVSRLPKNSIQMRGFVPERFASDSVDYIMRLCSEDKEEQQRFIHGFEVFEKIRNKIAASNVRKHFSTILGAGAFSKLFYKDIADDFGSRIHCVHFLNRPRPYYIYEKIGPTLDEIIRGSYYGFLDISTARHFAIGIIRALRTLHSLEYVHRCVTSYTFSLRTYPGGFIGDGDFSNHIVCNDLSFSTIYRSSKKPYFIEKKFYGTLKYSSPNAMKYYQQVPSDDIISALYIFVELCHGRLAWRGETDRDEIVRKKEDFFVHPTIMVDNIDAEFRIPIDIRDLTLIFKMLKEYNPYSGKLNYIYVCEILHRIAEANKQPDTIESYLDFTKLSNIENEFKKAMIHIQKGGQPSQPTTTVTTTTVKNPPQQSANEKDKSAKASKGLSREAAKKSDVKGKGKSNENVKKKKGSKEDAKVSDGYF